LNGTGVASRANENRYSLLHRQMMLISIDPTLKLAARRADPGNSSLWGCQGQQYAEQARGSRGSWVLAARRSFERSLAWPSNLHITGH